MIVGSGNLLNPDNLSFRLVVIRNISRQPIDNSRYDGLKKVAKLIVWNDPVQLRNALVSANLISDQTAPDANTNLGME